MSESTRTTAVAGRVEPALGEEIRRFAVTNGLSVSAVVADLIRRSAPMLIAERRNVQS